VCDLSLSNFRIITAKKKQIQH